MKSSYNKTKWVDNRTPVNAQNLNKIESALSDLYTNALQGEEIIEGEGVSINDSKAGGRVISVDNTVQRSQTCTGIEWVTEEPETPEINKLYLILDGETRLLKKIVLNGVTIFNVN